MKYIKEFFTKDSYQTSRTLLAYFFLASIVATILFWRFPNNVTAPNFYAEDGSVFLQNIMDKGWLSSAFTTFNGYSIIGLYLICGVGWVINLILLGGTLLTLAQAFALSAILFMAAVVTLPYPLFYKQFGKLRTLAVVALSALMPLPTSPHVVIGTVGNQKWVFLYLAFLLITFRVINHKKLGFGQLVLIDGALLISAYTNSTVYFLIPILLLPYISDYIQTAQRKKITRFVRKEFGRIDTRSLCLLYVLLLPQVIYVATHGIPKLAGYLDTPFNPDRTIELFINRTYLFGITHILNGHMTDLFALILFAGLLYIGVSLLRGVERFTFLFGIYAAGAASLLFVANRPGVTDYFLGYRSDGSGPDQFFYAQTLVMYLPLVLVCWGVASLLNSRRDYARNLLFALVISAIFAAGLVSNVRFGQQWRNVSVFENNAGILTDQAITACKIPGSLVHIIVYPVKSGQFSIAVPRDQVCTKELDTYQRAYQDLGLTVNNNDYLPITRSGMFTQSFKVDENGLSGLRIFLSTFGKPHRSGQYALKLLDATCRNEIVEVRIPTDLVDNSFYNLRFKPIMDSAKKSYCFTINTPNGEYDKIALQRSKPSVYGAGLLTQDGNPDNTDVVFGLIFTSRR